MRSDELLWKIQRLSRMSPGEVATRSWRAGRDRLRQARWQSRRLPRDYELLAAGSLRLLRLDRPATRWDRAGFLLAEDLPPAGSSSYAEWLEMPAAAAAVKAGWCPLFNLAHVLVRQASDWHRDPCGGGEWPRDFAPLLNHRETSRGGVRFLWELHRLPQLAILGRAYRRTGDPTWAAAVARVIESWLQANPPEEGIAWQSPLELAIRMIAILHAADLIAGSGAIDRQLGGKLDLCAAHHAAAIARSVSCGSSANNHTIGEAVGLVVVGAALPALRPAKRWLRRGMAILEKELARQFAADGSGREQAPHYQAFATGFVLQAARSLIRAGQPIPEFMRDHLARSARFLGSLVLANDRAIEPADSDDGLVHGLGLSAQTAAAETAQAAAWAAGNLHQLPGHLRDRLLPTTRWLWSPAAAPLQTRRRSPRSLYHPDSGWALMRGGTPERTLFFDLGPHGLPPLDAHAHADALAIAIWVAGEALVIDPGTYLYHSGGRWRDHFRSTAAHATIAVDGRNQSELAGPFLWRGRAQTRLRACHLGGELELLSGEHRGYTRLADPLVHERRILHLGDGRFVIHDRLRCAASHHVVFTLPLPPGTQLLGADQEVSEQGVAVHTETPGGARLDLLIGSSTPLRLSRIEGHEQEPAGWASPSFGQRVPAPAIRVSGQIEGETHLRLFVACAARVESSAVLIQEAAWQPVSNATGQRCDQALGLELRDSRGREVVFLAPARDQEDAFFVRSMRFTGLAAAVLEPADGSPMCVRSLHAQVDLPATAEHSNDRADCRIS